MSGPEKSMASDVHGDEAVSPEVSQALLELAEAEAEAAEAEAFAETARARAEAEWPASPGAVDAGEPLWRRWTRLPRGPKIAVSAGALLSVALLLVTGWMLGQHAHAAAGRAHDAEIVSAARNGVVALLSIDHTRAKADVQRVLDLSTGSFKDDFTKGADDFIKTAEASKAVTQGSVSAAALEKFEGESAVVLIAAGTQVTNANGAKQDPRAFRMSVTVSRDGGQLKMSDVEFVP